MITYLIKNGNKVLLSNTKKFLYRTVIIFISVFFLFTTNIFAQQYDLTGTVKNAKNLKLLSFANIRIKDTSFGTAASSDGKYELKLLPGKYSIIASYIGFKSDTIKINIHSNKTLNFALNPIAIRLPEITVLPGINPAIALMKKVLKAKKQRNKKLKSYIFKAYTKAIFKFTKKFTATNNGINLSIGVKDTAKLKIAAIMENESKGYFKKPDYYKTEIIARKQTANFPPTINILTGGRIMQNFYHNTIQFFNTPLPSPIADDALNHYYYYIEDTLAMDHRTIFQLYFNTLDPSEPGFYGKLYIADSLYSLIKIDAYLNSAAKPNGIFKKINVFQQFMPYGDNIYMPIDYRLFVNGNFLGLAKFGFDVSTIFYNYKINVPINNSVFGMAVLTVLPGADNKDSLFWKNTQTIPYTKAEIKAYKKIDSLATVHKSFWKRFSFISTRESLTKNFSISGPLELYHFNKVEGNGLSFGFYFNDFSNKRISSSLKLGYGFADKKFKYNFYSKYLFGNYRTTALSFHGFNNLGILFSKSDHYNRLTSTIMSLVSKYDFRNYYYSKGFYINTSSEVFPILKLGVGYLNRTDRSAVNNTNFSIFNRSKKYNNNLSIYNTKINDITASFTLDFRKYIENGYFRRRISQGKSYFILDGEATFSNRSLLKSALNFNSYKLNLYSTLNLFRMTELKFNIEGIYSTGIVPYQMLYALPGNIQNGGKNFSFRTLRIGEAFGDKAVVAEFEYNLRDELFKISKIPYLKNSHIQFMIHGAGAYLNISNKTASVIPRVGEIFKHPFFEIGFSLGHALFPLQLEFTWKLNYRGKNNFVLGINTFAL